MNKTATPSSVYALAGSNIFLGILMSGMSFPFLAKRVLPNSSFGFRTEKTLSSTEIWYAANIFAAQATLWVASVMIISGVLLILWCRSGKYSNLLLVKLGLVFEILPLVFLIVTLYMYQRTI